MSDKLLTIKLDLVFYNTLIVKATKNRFYEQFLLSSIFSQESKHLRIIINYIEAYSITYILKLIPLQSLNTHPRYNKLYFIYLIQFAPVITNCHQGTRNIYNLFTI